ncbi:MAG: hypothetical protein WDN04_26755 [Rhodospirillales bacterium]
MAIIGVLVSFATSMIASEVGVLEEPMMRSALSADVNWRAFLTASVGSVASSSTM